MATELQKQSTADVYALYQYATQNSGLFTNPTNLHRLYWQHIMIECSKELDARVKQIFDDSLEKKG